MLAKTLSAAISGLEVSAVEVEVDLRRQLESQESQRGTVMTIGGLPDTAIRESRERIWAALRETGAFLPQNSRITVNLAPADLRKSGTAFDLPIALCLMRLLGQMPAPSTLERTMVIGELALDGGVRPTRGALSIAMAARGMGLERLIVPQENAREAAMAEGIDVFGVQTLREALELLANPGARQPQPSEASALFTVEREDGPDFSDVKGQESAKRAIVAAAAGGHNLLLIGNPGCGKTLMAKRIPGILPPLTLPEALEVTKIHSIAGVLDSRRGLVTLRPFRSPHHTISDGGLVGGSANPRPGELSLAHNGVLFLDELPEFRRSTLEVLRQPLESGEVTLARASGTFTFPAKVMLVAAMNPCPCGYYGSRVRRCTYTPFQIQSYRSRLSGPLVDRLDMHIEIASVTHDQLIGRRNGLSSQTMREQVLQARDIQYRRFQGTSVRCNADMAGRLLDECCHLGPDEQTLVRQIITDLRLSARAYDRILKVARTLADLDGHPDISAVNLREAATYRFLDRQE